GRPGGRVRVTACRCADPAAAARRREVHSGGVRPDEGGGSGGRVAVGCRLAVVGWTLTAAGGISGATRCYLRPTMGALTGIRLLELARVPPAELPGML